MTPFFKKYDLRLLDPLYSKIIYYRSLSERLEYCSSLLFRIRKDLMNEESLDEIKRLKRLLKATEKEIIVLNKLTKRNIKE